MGGFQNVLQLSALLRGQNSAARHRAGEVARDAHRHRPCRGLRVVRPLCFGWSRSRGRPSGRDSRARLPPAVVRRSGHQHVPGRKESRLLPFRGGTYLSRRLRSPRCRGAPCMVEAPLTPSAPPINANAQEGLGRLSEAVEQRLGGPEIGGAKALGEAAVERREELTRRLGPALCMPQAGEAGGAAQLHGQNPLLARPVQRVLEVLLGPGGGARGSRQQDQFALDAQELRDAPMLLVTLGSGERLVDRGESLGDLPASGQPLRKAAEQGGMVRDEAGFAELVEGVAEKRESAADLAALDEQDAIEAATPRVPDGERVPGRMVEQYRHEAFGGRQIADPERDQTRRLQRVAQRERMIDRPRVLDVLLGGPQSLIGESLQPEDPRQYHAACHLLVVLKADGVRPASRSDIAAEHALEVPPCVRLVSQVVYFDDDQPPP